MGPPPVPETAGREPSRAAPAPPAPTEPPGLAPLSAIRRRQRYCVNPWRVHDGCAVRLLRNGDEAYPAMLDAIAVAQDFILFETYIFRSDDTGWAFARALAERARAGVAVRVMYDAVGCLGTDAALFALLREAGATLVEFHPVAPWRRRWGLMRRNHRKVLVVDGHTGFAGGLNVGDEYRSGGGRVAWRDTHVETRGPAVRELARLFRAIWQRAGGAPLAPARFLPLPREVGDTPALVLGGTLRRGRALIRRAYLHAIRQARHSIRIQNAYFIPDRGIVRALRNAVRRGVDVRVMVPARSDVRLVQYASRALFTKLLRAGVRLYEWSASMLHAKTAAVDRFWSVVGSYNLDHRSLRYNLEVAVGVLDETFARELETQFLADAQHCTEVQLERWERRGFFTRLIERLAYLFRFWI